MTELHIVREPDRRREACLAGASLLSDLLPSISDPDMRERADAVRQDLLLASLPDGGVDYRGHTPRRGDPMTLDEAKALVGKRIASSAGATLDVSADDDGGWPWLVSSRLGCRVRQLGPWLTQWVEVDP